MLLWQQPATVRCQGFDRLPLVFLTILVLFIYNFNKPTFDHVIIVKKEIHQLSKNGPTTISVAKKFREVGNGAPIHNESSQFNPFNGSVVSNTNDVMMAYSHNSFGLELMERPVKSILFWNEAYGSKDYGIGFGQQGFRQLNCPITECYTTDNRSFFAATEEFDAIVFHLRTFNIEDLPPTRSKHQRWILWSLESPQYNMRDIYPLDGLFNWTMTYRRDSDVIQPYGWVQPTGPFKLRPELEEINGEMALSATRKPTTKKTKLIAWFVSNCQTRSLREKYVDALAEHIKVDVYGDCGSLSCDRDNAANCYSMLEQDYKFYLSFENSFCDDYVTEKFFSILQLEVVPIVFGGSNYSAMAPPHSYINAQDFETARQLADYLKTLDSDNELYNQYFWWKPHYRIRNHIQDLKLSMCGLCTRLHYDKALRIYDDMEKWWVRESHCHLPRRDNVFHIPFWTN
ncbi:alpha-(1,3)-fucosyltransferase C-like [Daphnia carinata]|uniref:alpha-(1,3)-fucosyltransferase C-like n=1 Tax=Daphnia carinata TaxID=120202 RepID=UPI00257C0A84|nr:alpha-(1,3)-fucosyltransferase C-like [Daphnia carinata]